MQLVTKPSTKVALVQIWEDSLSTVHAVEPSEAMKQLGTQIERQWQSQAAEPAVEESDRLADLESRRGPSDAEQDPLGEFMTILPWIRALAIHAV